MISNEERREAARKLRVDIKNSMEIGYRCSNSEIELYICDILGLRCSECAHSWSGLEELAVLIEPQERTCRQVMPPYEQGVEELPVCSACGKRLHLEDDESYCSHCGARVMEED